MPNFGDNDGKDNNLILRELRICKILSRRDFFIIFGKKLPVDEKFLPVRTGSEFKNPEGYGRTDPPRKSVTLKNAFEAGIATLADR